MENVPYNALKGRYGDIIRSCPYLNDATEEFLKIAASQSARRQEERRKPWRMFCTTTNFEEEWQTVLLNIEGEPPADAQALDAIEAFCSGVKRVYPTQIRGLNPVHYCCWELKTSDVRIYGWFVEKDFFIAHAIADANKTHGASGYKGVEKCVQLIDKFREDLPHLLSLPMKGKGTNYVLSNKV